MRPVEGVGRGEGVLRTTRRAALRGGLALAGLGLLAGCRGLPLPWTPPARPARIGFLAPSVQGAGSILYPTFTDALRELGYVDGQTVEIEYRESDGREEQLPELVAELVRSRVELIVTAGPAATRAAQRVAPTLPIVFATADDPVADGLVDSLARPGRNATGLTVTAGQEHAKRLELLKEACPDVSRVAALWWTQSTPRSFRETESAGGRLGLEVLSVELHEVGDLRAALERAAGARADGLLTTAGALFSSVLPPIVEFVGSRRMPSVFAQSNFARAGGLLSYGAIVPANYRRAASYVDKILRGARPGDLPVEQPSTFEFLVNLRAAAALGRTLPSTTLQQATEVIR